MNLLLPLLNMEAAAIGGVPTAARDFFRSRWAKQLHNSVIKGAGAAQKVIMERHFTQRSSAL